MSAVIERTKYLFIINGNYAGDNKIKNTDAAQNMIKDIFKVIAKTSTSSHEPYADTLVNKSKVEIIDTIRRIASNPLYTNYIIYIFGHGRENISTKIPQFFTVNMEIIEINEITNLFRENKNLFILMDACRVPTDMNLNKEYEHLYNPEMTGLFALIQGNERATPAYYKIDRADPVLTAYYKSIKEELPTSAKSHVTSIINTIINHDSQFEDKTKNIPKFYFNKKMRDTYPDIITTIRRKITLQTPESIMATRFNNPEQIKAEKMIRFYELMKNGLFNNDKIILLQKILDKKREAYLSEEQKNKYMANLAQCLHKKNDSINQLKNMVLMIVPRDICNRFNEVLGLLENIIAKSNYESLYILNTKFQDKCKAHQPILNTDSLINNYKDMIAYLKQIRDEIMKLEKNYVFNELVTIINIRITDMENKFK